MGKHDHLSVPQDDEADKEADRAPSLIERVVRNFDLVKLAPAPIPADLVPPVAQRRRYRRAEEVVDAEVTPLAEAPVPSARQAGTVLPETSDLIPEVVEPELLTPSAPANLPAAVAVPVRFGGAKHAVSRQHLRDQGLIVPGGSVTTLLEEVRIIKRQLLFNANQLAQHGLGAAAQRILVCSPHPSEGKSFTSVNLALAFAAEKESEVLLVDADFAKPSVLRMLGIPGGPGLMDAVSNPDVDVAECVLGTDVPGLWVVPAGVATVSDSEYLTSSRTAAVLERLTQGAPHRIVIFDSPPVLMASPAAELAKYVGQTVLVARADTTGRGALEDAVSLLSGCPNIQLLLNAAQFSPSGRRFGSYYGYGE